MGGSKDAKYYSCFLKDVVHRGSMSDPLLDGADGHIKHCFMVTGAKVLELTLGLTICHHQ